MSKWKKYKASIIIRTKNEARWIGPCLRVIMQQDYKNFEIIIVDNYSEDGTLDIVKQFNVKIISIKDYLPGLALNKGILSASGKFIVMISGHCIPSDKKWLGRLIKNFKDEKVAGVYGRQLPMNFSSAQTKRDLLITFGLDRRVHIKDSFFHNANSAIRRDIWEKFPFDEKTSNIEDRLWAREVLNNGYTNVYDPLASVYHHHGIHHDNANERMIKTAKIIEKMDEENLNYGNLTPNNVKIMTLIPHTGAILSYRENQLLRKQLNILYQMIS